MTISDLKIGQSAIINNICGNDKLVKRLLSLGYTEGTKITVRASAPLGDPILINARGFNLALRKKDAKYINIRNL